MHKRHRLSVTTVTWGYSYRCRPPPAGKSTHRPDPTLGPRQNRTTETHGGLSECFFSGRVYLEYPAGLGLLRDAQKGLVWVDLELTTRMC